MTWTLISKRMSVTPASLYCLTSFLYSGIFFRFSSAYMDKLEQTFSGVFVTPWSGHDLDFVALVFSPLNLVLFIISNKVLAVQHSMNIILKLSKGFLKQVILTILSMLFLRFDGGTKWNGIKEIAWLFRHKAYTKLSTIVINTVWIFIFYKNPSYLMVWQVKALNYK